ncbi:MAG: dTDP-4-dehydrorhamnose 3,5-epimerase family protein [Candidatus Limnocylindrales bacterium]
MTSESASLTSPASSALSGVQFGHLVSHGDVRGSFTELWRASNPATGRDPFVQANLSTSSQGVLRGLHLHQRQLDYWVVVSGKAFVALVDARGPISGVTPVAAVETRELAPNDWVVIPAGVAHGFLALEATRLLYLVTNEYDGSDELGFAWDDPAVAVPWPVLRATADGRPIVSERDAANPSLAELVARLRR